jgi:hypothetical protein
MPSMGHLTGPGETAVGLILSSLCALHPHTTGWSGTCAGTADWIRIPWFTHLSKHPTESEFNKFKWPASREAISRSGRPPYGNIWRCRSCTESFRNRWRGKSEMPTNGIRAEEARRTAKPSMSLEIL